MAKIRTIMGTKFNIQPVPISCIKSLRKGTLAMPNKDLQTHGSYRNKNKNILELNNKKHFKVLLISFTLTKC